TTRGRRPRGPARPAAARLVRGHPPAGPLRPASPRPARLLAPRARRRGDHAARGRQLLNPKTRDTSGPWEGPEVSRIRAEPPPEARPIRITATGARGRWPGRRGRGAQGLLAMA